MSRRNMHRFKLKISPSMRCPVERKGKTCVKELGHVGKHKDPKYGNWA